jgi:hypothetical protein
MAQAAPSLSPHAGDRQTPRDLIEWAAKQRGLGRDAAISLLRDGIADATIAAWWMRGSGFVEIPKADSPLLMIDVDTGMGWLHLPDELLVKSEWAQEPVRFSRKDFDATLSARARGPKHGGGPPPIHLWFDASADLAASVASTGCGTSQDIIKLLTEILTDLGSAPDGKDIRKHALRFFDRYQRRMG